MLQRTALFLAVLSALLTAIGFAQPADFFQNDMPMQEPVQAEIIVEQETIQPGSSFWVGVRLKLDEKWHAYWKNPGDGGMAPMIDWQLPEGYTAEEILWPTPKKFQLNESVGYGYEDEVTLLAKISSPSNAFGEATIGADIRWVVCDDASCLPGGAEVAISVPVSEKNPVANSKHQKSFTTARGQIPQPYQDAVVKSGDDLITIELRTPHDVIQAHFFPEDTDIIDHTVDAIVSKAEGMDDKYHVILKKGENASINEPLRGVVVIKTTQSNENNLIAYDVDLPIYAEFASDVALGIETAPPEMMEYTSAPHHFDGGFLLALALAFSGGLLLNLMPCVLPVLSFKVLSFVKMAGQSRGLVFKHGVAFSLGVILSFWALAGVLLSLQAYGHAVGWGFQLQQPFFVAILAAIILIFGLSMFGVFEIGTGLASMAGQAQVSNKSTGLQGSFFSGILATAVATPCTGPGLGTAVGFAVTLPASLAILIFTALGLGMAFPYLLLGAFPGLLKYFPKPGNWMVTFKEIIGFVMMATVLWLVWVFGAQTNALAVFFLLTGFFFLAIACWIYGKWGSPMNKKRTRILSYVTASPFLCLGAYTLFFSSTLPPYCFDDSPNESIVAMADDGRHSSGWERFSPERVEELRKKGIPVFVDFTAKWCLICQANHLVLTTDEVESKFNELGVVKMKADWTRSNPIITEELKKYGRNSVPLYLLFSANAGEPAVILPQVLTQDTVLEYLGQIEESLAGTHDKERF